MERCIEVIEVIEEIRISKENYIKLAEKRLKEYFNYLAIDKQGREYYKEYYKDDFDKTISRIKKVLEHKEWIYLPFLSEYKEMPFIYGEEQFLELDNKFYLVRFYKKNAYDKDVCKIENVTEEIPIGFYTNDELEIELNFLGEWTKLPFRKSYEYCGDDYDRTDWDNRQKRDNCYYGFYGNLSVNFIRDNNIVYYNKNKDKKIGINKYIVAGMHEYNNIIINDIDTLKRLYITTKINYDEFLETNWIANVIIIKNSEINAELLKLLKSLGNVVVLIDCKIMKHKEILYSVTEYREFLEEMRIVLKNTYCVDDLEKISCFGDGWLMYDPKNFNDITKELEPVKKEWGNDPCDWFGDDDDSDELQQFEERIGLGDMNNVVKVLEVVEELRK